MDTGKSDAGYDIHSNGAVQTGSAASKSDSKPTNNTGSTNIAAEPDNRTRYADGRARPDFTAVDDRLPAVNKQSEPHLLHLHGQSAVHAIHHQHRDHTDYWRCTRSSGHAERRLRSVGKGRCHQGTELGEESEGERGERK